MSLEEYDFNKIGIFLSILLIIIGGIIGGVSGFYYYNKFQVTEKRFREASVVNQQDVDSLVSKVGKLIKLPEGENPTIATITDLTRLKNQAFFAKAKIGDKILLYPQNKKAFLYDPLENRIIEAGPLIIPTITPLTAQTSDSANIAGIAVQISPAPVASSVKIALFNGTATASVSEKFEAELSSKIKNFKLIQKANSLKRDYSKSVIIDLTGSNKTVLDSIAATLSLEESALPADEKSPSGADILIILGSDRLLKQS